jgi:hypothetical protein
MTQLTQEEIRDEVLSIFEDNEQKLLEISEEVDRIEKDAVELFERKSIALKNALVSDEGIKEENLESVYVESIGKLRNQILTETKEKIANLTKALS